MLRKTKFANQRASAHEHGRPQGGGAKGGYLLPLMEFEKDDGICCPPAKYPNIFGRAFGARNNNP